MVHGLAMVVNMAAAAISGAVIGLIFKLWAAIAPVGGDLFDDRDGYRRLCVISGIRDGVHADDHLERV